MVEAIVVAAIDDSTEARVDMEVTTVDMAAIPAVDMEAIPVVVMDKVDTVGMVDTARVATQEEVMADTGKVVTQDMDRVVDKVNLTQVQMHSHKISTWDSGHSMQAYPSPAQVPVHKLDPVQTDSENKQSQGHGSPFFQNLVLFITSTHCTLLD